MLRVLAILLGLSFIILGALGFTATFNIKGYLFDIFRVNFEHNMTHIVTGIIALLCGVASSYASKVMFIILGLAYGAFALFGYFFGEGLLFQMIAINGPANILHGLVALTFLLIGLTLRH